VTKFVNIAIAVAVASVPAINSVCAQNTTTNTTTTQQTSHSNTTSASLPLKTPNTNAIVDAINAKIRSIYDNNNEKATNSVTKIDHDHDK
jgi:Tfp pilus assembly protein FimT